MGTRTGNFPIGFRRGWSDWQKQSVKNLADWAKANGFDLLDLMNLTLDELKTVRDAGLEIGSVDLLDFGNLLSTDAAKRKELVAKNLDYVKQLATARVKVFFTCIIPGDPTKKRSENYALAIETYSPIAHKCAEHGATLVIEGWPGSAPHFANLCCTPETYRAFIKDVGRGVGVNYDPSHLIRLGVDHLRFLKEFLPHVKHVHAKDTAIDTDAQYEFGAQPAAFAKSHGFGEWIWRYTIPGHGIADWPAIFAALKSANYSGAVSIELEDENFNGSEEGEKAALLGSLNFLRNT